MGMRRIFRSLRNDFGDVLPLKLADDRATWYADVLVRPRHVDIPEHPRHGAKTTARHVSHLLTSTFCTIVCKCVMYAAEMFLAQFIQM